MDLFETPFKIIWVGEYLSIDLFDTAENIMHLFSRNTTYMILLQGLCMMFSDAFNNIAVIS
jgi:hypothetical protein